jgi:hypothetical protein
MGGLTLICFARASYAELDPGTTQSVHEPLFDYQNVQKVPDVGSVALSVMEPEVVSYKRIHFMLQVILIENESHAYYACHSVPASSC